VHQIEWACYHDGPMPRPNNGGGRLAEARARAAPESELEGLTVTLAGQPVRGPAGELPSLPSQLAKF
jgi:hypothetical protein